MKAKHNNKEVVVTYVEPSLSWALVSEDLKNRTQKYKVDVIELEDYDRFELEELAQKNKK